jgi:hypothetical protein
VGSPFLQRIRHSAELANGTHRHYQQTFLDWQTSSDQYRGDCFFQRSSQAFISHIFCKNVHLVYQTANEIKSSLDFSVSSGPVLNGTYCFVSSYLY